MYDDIHIVLYKKNILMAVNNLVVVFMFVIKNIPKCLNLHIFVLIYV